MNNIFYLMGIDIGTTNTKIGVYDPDGRKLVLKESSTPIFSRSSGEAEFNPDLMWRNLCQIIQQIPAQIRNELGAVSISSFAETVYPLGFTGNPLDNGIAWFDRRTILQNEQIKNLFDPTLIRKITGLFPTWIYSLNKILWYRENKPDLWRKIKLWLDNAGYIIFKLSGEKVIDYSLACRTMMFDVWKKRWSKKILNAFDLNPNTLPDPIPSGTAVGKISRRASEETGLQESTLVIAGGHDHLCAALSVGAIEEGKILDSTGTTQTLVLGFKRAQEVDKRAIQERFILADHVAKDTFCLLQGIYCGGLLLDWFLNKVLKDKNYQVLEKVQYEQHSPLFIPYLRGSDFGVMSGALFGLKDFHTRNSIVNCIMETIAFELMRMMEGLEKIINKDTSEWVLRSAGGSARNNLLLKYKANLLNKRIEVPVNLEVACQGAALLAGIGSGLYANEVEAVKRTFKISRVYTPEASEVEKSHTRYLRYGKALERYKQIENKLTHL